MFRDEGADRPSARGLGGGLLERNVPGLPWFKRSVSGEHVTVNHGAVGVAAADRLRLRQSATGLALGREIGVHQAGGLLIAGGRVGVERSVTQWLVGAHVEARQTIALAVIAGQVSGSVRCLFDARGAAILGVIFALTAIIVRLIGGRR